MVFAAFFLLCFFFLVMLLLVWGMISMAWTDRILAKSRLRDCNMRSMLELKQNIDFVVVGILIFCFLFVVSTYTG